jgi:hypothetical protein
MSVFGLKSLSASDNKLTRWRAGKMSRLMKSPYDQAVSVIVNANHSIM